MNAHRCAQGGGQGIADLKFRTDGATGKRRACAGPPTDAAVHNEAYSAAGEVVALA
jgi:hypothetical protein